MLNHSGQLGNGFNAPVPIYDITFSFKPQKPVKSVKSLQNGKDIPFKTKGKSIELSLAELNSFDVVLVEY